MLSKKQKIVLSYPKLKERIELRDSPDAERKKALKNLEEIQADFSPAYIGTFERMLDGSLAKLYDDMNFDDNVVDLEKLVKEKNVVLVPNHQSHADYLAINYLFYKKYKFPLYVAGGVNLNIFPIGNLFRKSGCFFIRRSFASDITYKLTLEAYLYYLLKMGRPVEFFFEGGRSRSGKLLPPRFGLYSMLLEAHQVLKEEADARELVFVPVSIIHEYVPETKSLAEELMGKKKKKKESATQLFGLLKLLSYQFGSVNIRLGRPVEANFENSDDLKKVTQDLAFKCFREVGKNMMVTPTSLLAMVLLDEPSGAMPWHDIMSKATAIRKHCEKFNVPLTDSLNFDRFEKSLERAMDIMIGNKRVDVIGREHHGHLYYSIRESCRAEILYSKNTILHHFLVPSIICQVWFSLFSGKMSSVKDLKEFFLSQRRQLKHEFYLPTLKQFFYGALSIVSDAVGRRVSTLEELMSFTPKELYTIISKLGVFSRALSYINEAYYISGLSLYYLAENYPEGFKFEAFQKKSEEVFDKELSLGRLIRYPESFSIPLLRSSLKYFTHLGLIENKEGMICVKGRDDFKSLIEQYEKDLNDQLSVNFRVQGE